MTTSPEFATKFPSGMAFSGRSAIDDFQSEEDLYVRISPDLLRQELVNFSSMIKFRQSFNRSAHGGKPEYVLWPRFFDWKIRAIKVNALKSGSFTSGENEHFSSEPRHTPTTVENVENYHHAEVFVVSENKEMLQGKPNKVWKDYKLWLGKLLAQNGREIATDWSKVIGELIDRPHGQP